MIRFLLTSAAFLRTDAVLLMALAVTLAVSAPFLARHPRVMRYAKHREEKRILSAPLPPRPSSAPLPAFREGPVPSHEDCDVLPGEEILFGLIAGKLGYGWITDALKAREEADQ